MIAHQCRLRYLATQPRGIFTCTQFQSDCGAPTVARVPVAGQWAKSGRLCPLSLPISFSILCTELRSTFLYHNVTYGSLYSFIYHSPSPQNDPHAYFFISLLSLLLLKHLINSTLFYRINFSQHVYHLLLK